MNTPEQLLFTKDHEWVKVEGQEAVIGISDYAQNELGEIVFVELPEVGASFQKTDVFGSVEAVKAVSELFMPISGEVLAINEGLSEQPEWINEDPYSKGWMLRIRIADASELEQLLSENAYQEFVK
ncbi:MAG: glycine cleavage system protein GcvH [Bacteroidales bacterium]|jgi:glycine cleavage system H protein|nr:glycine cleavage system protein GcvH [Bacteroidales bacterium]HKL93340.1 glycine cleavage system protein GcvH [Bacteroidales bacterium]